VLTKQNLYATQNSERLEDIVRLEAIGVDEEDITDNKGFSYSD